jgi:hypothetical protein
MRALGLSCLFCCLTFSAHGWGVLGHEAMAAVAQRLLSNDVAVTVQRILGTNEMASVAVWADQLRDAQRIRGPLAANPEVREFNRRFPNNATWHYVNLPLGTLRYDHDSRFASTNDIVHAMNLCLAVLEGRSREMSKTHALRWLIHLVGDLHQPLHAGCGYYRFEPDGKVVLLRQPGEIEAHPHDLGGNILRFGGRLGLHGYWDVGLVDSIDASPRNGQLERIITEALEPKRWRTSGRLTRWAAKWATDSVEQARAAYEGVTFQTAQFNDLGAVTNIVISLPPNYQSNQTHRAKAQLSKSAFHLAEILNRLHWE